MKLNSRLIELEKEKKTIMSIIEEISENSIPKCPYCHVANLRFNKDDTCFCRSCGQWSEKIGNMVVKK